MKLSKSDYIPISVAVAIAIVTTVFTLDKNPGDYLGIYASIADIISLAITIYGICIVADWRKEKGKELIYSKCTELHSVLYTFPIFIQITTNYIYGNSERCSHHSNDPEKLKKITLEINILIFEKTQEQLMRLMTSLGLYPQISGIINKSFENEVKYLFLIYTDFCKGLYCPISINGKPNEKILKLQEELKSAKYKESIGKVNTAKIEELFMLEK
ncbi:hypothetical protein DVF26_21245 [Salmonella enterica subsp. enterica]|nr:hypothetical protein [Salmonella enterica subsp. enterica]